MGIREVKNNLKNLDKKQLIDLIGELYKKNKSVKEYFDFYVNPNENELLSKYRDKVFETFFPKRGFGYNLKEGKKAISDFKKLGVSNDSLADLMLFYVETGVEFTNDFGDINESFYSSLEKTYEQALNLMYENGVLEKFASRAQKVMSDTSDIGWGFHDYIAQVYIDFYADYLENN
ncbi:hypothetical protein GM418_30730 [Maribellus comscasis]|uniref:Uncharacterized protein n=1 Tax=Maribellus comscasis TaxID=2681766 RepID=A0A6I6JXV6_9BACT|nr:DUF6155 family protein [Maribellus comscasis]QGY47875.1 hypothetical protein GM418_30730 [Maribellus comscasis]